MREIPSERHFVRDHFPVPELDPAAWSLQIDGERCLTLDERELRLLPPRSLAVVLECAGHRRNEFDPQPEGLPWACGAIAEARWTGTSLATLLARAGIPDGTLEVVLEGADCGESPGLPGSLHFARSLALEKALSRDVVVAYEMNGRAITVARGGPVRAVVPGWYATDSVKWLTRVWFTGEPFDGAFQAHDYLWRDPGETGPGRRMTDLPVHALITSPQGGAELAGGRVTVRGAAWGGSGGIAEVAVRVDDGAWRPAALAPRRGRYARTLWGLQCELGPGRHVLACRATDSAGHAQPATPPPNPGGYANNAIHRIEIAAR
jgi:DMSO/TMAO reductase YedYZ molybdopterin-dependent catalytic subunit